MDQDATRFGTEVDLGPGDIVLDGNQLPHVKGHSSPHFSAHFAVARSPSWALVLLFSPLQFDRRMCSQLNSHWASILVYNTLVVIQRVARFVSDSWDSFAFRFKWNWFMWLIYMAVCSTRSVDRLFRRCSVDDNVPTWNYFLLRTQVFYSEWIDNCRFENCQKLIFFRHICAISVFGRPFIKRFAVCYRPVVLSVLSVTLLYRGQTVGWIKMKLGTEVGLDPLHTVLDGNPALLPKLHSPQFSAHVRCGQKAGWIKMPLGMEVGLGPGDFVLDEDPAPPQRRGHSSQFSAHVYCGQTTGWTKMPLDMAVDLGPGDFVLDGDQAPLPPKGPAQQPPSFRPMLLWKNGRPSQLLLSTCYLIWLKRVWAINVITAEWLIILLNAVQIFNRIYII